MIQTLRQCPDYPVLNTCILHICDRLGWWSIADIFPGEPGWQDLPVRCWGLKLELTLAYGTGVVL